MTPEQHRDYADRLLNMAPDPSLDAHQATAHALLALAHYHRATDSSEPLLPAERVTVGANWTGLLGLVLLLGTTLAVVWMVTG